VPREPHGHEAILEASDIALPVPLERVPTAVVSVAVELHDHLLVHEQCVDLTPADGDVDLRPREPEAIGELAEFVLERRAGGRLIVEERPQPGRGAGQLKSCGW
jgi:hypothetical protein